MPAVERAERIGRTARAFGKIGGQIVALRARARGHGLGRLRVVRALDRVVLRMVRRQQVVEIAVLGHRILLEPNDVGIAPYILSAGVYEPQMTRMFERSITPGMTVLDVGANFGYFTLLAARGVGATGRVIAFEPVPRLRQLLTRNLAVNGYRGVAVEPLAVSNHSGTTTIYLDAANSGNPSMWESNVGAAAGGVSVQMVTLDEYVRSVGRLGRVDVVKLDVQGAEELVVAGATTVIGRMAHVVFLELWPEGLRNGGSDPLRLLTRLHQWGFSITVLWEGIPAVGSTNPNALIDCCDRRLHGYSHLNLLLERRQTVQ